MLKEYRRIDTAGRVCVIYYTDGEAQFHQLDGRVPLMRRLQPYDLQESWIGNWDINHLKSKLPNPNSWHWEHTPSWSDPRLPVLGILALYIVLGITVLGFNCSPVQILIGASSFGVAVLTH